MASTADSTNDHEALADEPSFGAADLLAEAVAALPEGIAHGLGRDQIQGLALQLDIALSLRDLVTAVNELTEQLSAGRGA